jgi:hypothetical protein
MTPLPLQRHHPAPAFDTKDAVGLPVSLRDYRFRRDLLLVLLHGPGCSYCAEILEEMAAHRADWEAWGTAALVLASEDGPLPEGPFRAGHDPDAAIRGRYAGEAADAVLAVVDQRGRLMDGWSLRHPEPVDWHEVAETARWVAVQEPECGACEVLPGWE